MKALDIIAFTLLVIGGLNWGLVALGQYDLVASLFGLRFGETSMATRIVYGLVGLAALYEALTVKGFQHRWDREHAPARA